MDQLVQAATGQSLATFALALAGIVIVALIWIVVWLVKDRIAERRRRDQLLEKRLAAGSIRMEALDRDLRDLDKTVRACALSMEHADRPDDCYYELGERIAQLEGRLEEGLRLTAKIIGYAIDPKDAARSSEERDEQS
jgi:biopolymer transport protein ExbB/TolQ